MSQSQRVPADGVFVTYYDDGSGPTTVHHSLRAAVATASGHRQIGFQPWDSTSGPIEIEPPTRPTLDLLERDA